MTERNFVTEYEYHPTANVVGMSYEILDRMEQAVLKVRERLLRSTAAMEVAGIPYAVVGGNAVASWVATKDEGAVRNTPDVDILIRREDLKATITALNSVGFINESLVAGELVLVDGPDCKPRSGITLLFFGEGCSDSIETFRDPGGFEVLTLEPLVRMKLKQNRTIDRVHVRDMIDVGLVDAGWLAKLPAELVDKLQHLLDTPDG
jgi:hypothetical protein